MIKENIMTIEEILARRESLMIEKLNLREKEVMFNQEIFDFLITKHSEFLTIQWKKMEYFVHGRECRRRD